MNQKTVGLTLRATIIALALILVVGSPALPPLDGVAYAQGGPTLTATALPDGSVDVSWTAVGGADSYDLYKQPEGGSWSAAMSKTEITYNDTSVTAGTKYFYIVRAITAGAEGPWSNTVSVTLPGGTAAPASAPTLNAAADGLTGVDLSWNAIPTATSYDLRRWNPDTSSWDSIGNNPTGTSHDDDGLDSGTQYWYVIRAVNAGGNGPWSSEGGVGYTSVTLPSTTSEPVLSLTHTSRTVVDLSWTAVAANATYVVQRQSVTDTDTSDTTDPVAGGWEDLDDDVTATAYQDDEADFIALVDTTPNQLTRYNYRVYALVDGEQTDYSNIKTVTIPETSSRPPVPASLTATVGGPDRITVTWANSAGADSHELRSKRESGNYSSPTTRTSGWSHTGLSADTEYTYQVRAVNVNGPSDWSGEVSATTSSTTSTSGQLGVPSGLRAADATDLMNTADDPSDDVAGIKVTWNRVSNADGYDLVVWMGTAYQEVTFGDANAEATVVAKREITVTSGSIDGDINANSTYIFVIRATAGETDRSDWSAPVSAKTNSIRPVVPTALAAAPRSESIIWVSWTAPEIGATTTTGGAAEGYTLQWRRSGSSANWNSIDVKGKTNYAHTGLRAGTTYLYRIRAYNSGGMSAYTHPDVETQTWASQLAIPSGLDSEDATTDTGAGVKISWSKVTGATAYDVEKWNPETPGWETFDANGAEDGTSTTATSFTDTGTGVVAGGSYWYIIRSLNGDVRSDWSAPVNGSAKQTDPPAMTLNLEPTGTNMIRLTWAAVANAESYELEWIEGALDAFTGFTSQTKVTLPATPTYYAHTGLKAGTRYSYRIRAMLPQDVTSTAGTLAQAVTRPLAPNLSLTAIDHETMKLTWTMVALDGAGLETVDNYTIERRKSGETAWVPITPLADTFDCVEADKECTVNDGGIQSGVDADNDGNDDPQLSDNTKYYYRIRATADLAEVLADDKLDVPAVTSYWDYASQRTSADPN